MAPSTQLLVPSMSGFKEENEKTEIDPSVSGYIKDIKGVDYALLPNFLPTAVPKIESYVEGQAYAEPFEFILDWRWQDFLPDWSQPFLPPIVICEDDSNEIVIKEWGEDGESGDVEESDLWCFLGRVFCEFKLLRLCNIEDDSAEKIEHCKCGLGCPSCYGKFNCGCPECYTPEKQKKELKEILFKSAMEIPKILYKICKVSHVNEAMEVVKTNSLIIKIDSEEVKVTRRVHKEVPTVQRRPMSFLDRSSASKARNRLSLPAPVKIKDPIKEATVLPPQQTKYYCKTCQCNICNACFTNKCKGHNVQFLGSSRFHCQSSSHVIQHQFSVFV